MVDLKSFNKVCSTESWPLPNIKQILQRLGSQRAVYFAAMDLTSAYHLAPLHPDCQKYSAYMTDLGLFEWTRLVMDLLGIM